MSKEKDQNSLSRRDFLRAAAMTVGGVAIAACGPTTAPPATSTPMPEVEPTAAPTEAPYGGPLGVEKGTIELHIREPGNQRAAAFDQMKEALLEMYPETDWELVYDMQNWDVLRPRFIAGDPPDGAWLSVSGDPWGLLDEGLLMDVSDLLEAPAYGEEGVKYKDLFLPGMLEPGQKDGKQYIMPKGVNTWGLWYSRSLAAEQGWEIPAEFPWPWDDFKATMNEIKDFGISPILSGGPGNAGSFFWAFWLNFAFQIGGNDHFNAMDSLTPGAWNNEIMVASLARMQELFAEELIDPLWSAIQWGDADTLVFQGEAFFKPDGQWFVGSNKDKIPEGFELGFAPAPTIPELEGSPAVMEANAEPSWLVPAEAKNPRGGMEWIRLWNSKPFSVVFAEVSGDILPIYDSGKGADWHPGSAEMLRYFGMAERYFNPMFHVWYAQLRDGLTEPFFNMATGTMTPQECADAWEAVAEQVRQDDSVTKHQRG
jgi:N-acetylglucosamine transport system substrate-binding protein